MITVSEQISKKDRVREIPTADDDHSENICIYVCELLFLFFSFSTLRVLMALGKEMRTGGLYERKHIDNCQYKTEEEICGNNRHDQLLLSLSLFLRFF